MIYRQINGLKIYLFERLLSFHQVEHFVSTRLGGVSDPPYDTLNLGFHVSDDSKRVLRNRQLLSSTLKKPLNCFVTCKQIHSGKVATVSNDMRGRGATEYDTAVDSTDALVTGENGLYLMVLVADCAPILLFDPVEKVIGVVHAGWRGLTAMVVQNTIRTFVDSFHSDAKHLVAAIGPSIGPCCYEVGPEVIVKAKSTFTNGHKLVRYSESKSYLNLWEAVRQQLLECGVLNENIELARLCTKCNSNLFFSERKQGSKTGRFGIGITISGGETFAT